MIQFRTSFILAIFLLSSYSEFFANQKIKTKDDNKIPFEYDGHIYIQVKLSNTFTEKFVFDTGADGFYLDSAYFEKNKHLYKQIVKSKIRGAGNSGYKEIPVILDTIHFEIGNRKLTSTQTIVLNLKSILGSDVYGIVGLDYFKQYVLKFNYKEKILTLLQPNDPSIPYKDSIGFSFIKNRIYINFSANINQHTQLKGLFQVDLGCGSNVVISGSTAKKYNLIQINPKIDYCFLSGGVSGASCGSIIKAKNISIGNFMFDNVVLDFSTDVSGALGKVEYLGLLGNKLFENFDFYIDFINRKLYFKRLNQVIVNDKSYLAGFSPIFIEGKQKMMIINCLYKPSDAEKAGMQLGDTIIRINNKPVNEYSRNDIRDVLKKENTNLSIIILKNNQEREIKVNIKDLLKN